MPFNQKDIRIIKLHEKGLSEVVIARKIGYCGENMQAGVDRVRETLRRYEKRT